MILSVKNIKTECLFWFGVEKQCQSLVTIKETLQWNERFTVFYYEYLSYLLNKIQKNNTYPLFMYQMIWFQMIWFQMWIFEFFNESNSKLEYKLSLYFSYDLNSKNEYLSL